VLFSSCINVRLQDRYGDGGGLPGRATKQDENSSQPENSAPGSSQQSLRPATWHSASGSGAGGSWLAGANSNAKDDGANALRGEAPINTHDFPSLAATAKKPAAARSKAEQVRPSPVFPVLMSCIASCLHVFTGQRPCRSHARVVPLAAGWHALAQVIVLLTRSALCRATHISRLMTEA
jgi:hypothetical protein